MTQRGTIKCAPDDVLEQRHCSVGADGGPYPISALMRTPSPVRPTGPLTHYASPKRSVMAWERLCYDRVCFKLTSSSRSLQIKLIATFPFLQFAWGLLAKEKRCLLTAPADCVAHKCLTEILRVRFFSLTVSLFNGAFMQQLLLSYLSTRERQTEVFGLYFQMAIAVGLSWCWGITVKIRMKVIQKHLFTHPGLLLLKTTSAQSHSNTYLCTFVCSF